MFRSKSVILEKKEIGPNARDSIVFTAVKEIIQPSDEGFRLLTPSRVVKGDISIEVFNGNVREGDETVSINLGTSYSLMTLLKALGVLL